MRYYQQSEPHALIHTSPLSRSPGSAPVLGMSILSIFTSLGHIWPFWQAPGCRMKAYKKPFLNYRRVHWFSVWLNDLFLYVPVNSFSVMSWRAKDTTRSGSCETRTCNPLISSQAVYHWGTALLADLMTCLQMILKSFLNFSSPWVGIEAWTSSTRDSAQTTELPRSKYAFWLFCTYFIVILNAAVHLNTFAAKHLKIPRCRASFKDAWILRVYGFNTEYLQNHLTYWCEYFTECC